MQYMQQPLREVVFHIDKAEKVLCRPEKKEELHPSEPSGFFDTFFTFSKSPV